MESQEDVVDIEWNPIPSQIEEEVSESQMSLRYYTCLEIIDVIVKGFILGFVDL